MLLDLFIVDACGDCFKCSLLDCYLRFSGLACFVMDLLQLFQGAEHQLFSFCAGVLVAERGGGRVKIFHLRISRSTGTARWFRWLGGVLKLKYDDDDDVMTNY